MNNEIIVIKQLPVIVEQLQTIKADVTAKVAEAMSLVCTEDTVKDVKKIRAELGKEFSEWEEKRKEVKKAVMLPYEQFETVYKDCITDVFKGADTELKAKVDSVETALKKEKEKEVYDYFAEYRESKIADGAEWVGFGYANINVTLSASLKSLKEQAKAFIDRICDDLNLIETQEHKDEILYEYKQSLNVSAAITKVSNRYKAIEEAKAKEAEREAKEQATQKAVEKVVEVLTPPTVEPIAEEKILTVQFTVKGTKTKLKALKEFLNNGGYDYE